MIKTNRCLLRDFNKDDTQNLFDLDSDPDVHIYLGKKHLKNIKEVPPILDHLLKQKIELGTARLAVINKENNEFIGWTGIKFINEPINNMVNFYELGYRFKKKYWGKGYATETGIASLEYGFNVLNAEKIAAFVDINNKASQHVLEKLGFKKLNQFEYDNAPHYFYELNKTDYFK